MDPHLIDNDTFTDKSSIKILIVDDFEPDVRSIKRMLASSHSSAILPPLLVRAVDSIGKALSLYRTFRPDCILLDYSLPDMSGLDLVETILSTEGELSAAIVMMTGVGDENLAVKAMKLGVHDYLVKGQVTEEQLGWTIISAVERLHLQQQITQQHEDLQLFASYASHDMVSPLTNLSLYVESLHELYADQIKDSADTLDSILHIIDHMTGMIEGLSAYARVGRSNVPFDSVNLQEIYRCLLLISEVEIENTNATIKADPLPTIYGDRSGLSQLFQNLISNAIKYRSHVAPVIKILSEEQEQEYHFRVCDNGIGIDPMFQSEVFAPFKRLHSRTEYPGSGLGLATCKKIVEHHQGQIWIESALGQGTTVHIKLPKVPINRPLHRFMAKERGFDKSILRDIDLLSTNSRRSANETLFSH